MLRHLLFLLEGTGEQIREFYKEIPESIYYDILKTDPTGIIRNGKVDKVGKYSKHLLEIYKKTKFNKKELDGLEDILKTYEKVQREVGKPFNQIKNIDEIKELVNNVSEKAKAEKESKIIMKDSGYTVRQILGKNAAIYYGNYCGHNKDPEINQSTWCTSYRDSSSYEQYKNGELYIVSKGEELIAQLYYDKNKEEIQDRFNSEFDIDKLPNKLTTFFEEKTTGIYYKFKGRKFKYKLNNNIISFLDIYLDDMNLTNKDLLELPWIDKKWNCERVNLALNNLTYIYEDIFKNCIKLIDLTVSDNLLTELDNLPECRNLYADNNKINKVNVDCVMLDLANNEINNLDNIKFTNKLSLIELKYNKVTTVTAKQILHFKDIKFIFNGNTRKILTKESINECLFGNPIDKESIKILDFTKYSSYMKGYLSYSNEQIKYAHKILEVSRKTAEDLKIFFDKLLKIIDNKNRLTTSEYSLSFELSSYKSTIYLTSNSIRFLKGSNEVEQELYKFDPIKFFDDIKKYIEQ